jgi:hypothetical protein
MGIVFLENDYFMPGKDEKGTVCGFCRLVMCEIKMLTTVYFDLKSKYTPTFIGFDYVFVCKTIAYKYIKLGI